MAGGDSLSARETVYRQAARVFDYFMTGLAAVFLLTSGVTMGSEHSLPEILDLIAIVLFALALIAGISKLEAFITILGSEYSIAVTQRGHSGLSVQDSAAVLRDLGETVEKLSYRAALIHRARHLATLSGVLFIALSALVEVIMAM